MAGSNRGVVVRQRMLAAVIVALASCGDSGGSSGPSRPAGLSGRWRSDAVSTTAGSVSLDAVIAETGGVLTGSGTLTMSGCPGSPFPVTVTGARAGADVSFTLLPRDVNFTGSFASDSIAGAVTGLYCAGMLILAPSMVLRR